MASTDATYPFWTFWSVDLFLDTPYVFLLPHDLRVVDQTSNFLRQGHRIKGAVRLLKMPEKLSIVDLSDQCAGNISIYICQLAQIWQFYCKHILIRNTQLLGSQERVLATSNQNIYVWLKSTTTLAKGKFYSNKYQEQKKINPWIFYFFHAYFVSCSNRSSWIFLLRICDFAVFFQRIRSRSHYALCPARRRRVSSGCDYSQEVSCVLVIYMIFM